MKLKLGRHDQDLSHFKSCVFYSGRIRTLVAMANYISHRLIMGKEEIDNFFCLIGDIWIFFLQKYLLSSPLRFIQLLSKSVNLIGCRCGKKGQFFVKCLKIFFSETIRGMKLKLGRHDQDLSLFKSCVFYSGQIRTLVAMATYSSHRLIMGKEEIDIFFCLILDIWNFLLQKCLLSSPLHFIRLLSKSVNLIGCRRGKNGQFS